MTREILFKAKRLDNGAWVEGSLITYKDGTAFICCEDYIPDVLNKYEVDPSTVCQYTGLTDKNGKKICENYIVNHNGEYAPVKFGMYCSSFDYGSYNFGFYVDFPEETFYRKELGYWHRKIETAGNVFDNPELLQEESDE